MRVHLARAGGIAVVRPCSEPNRRRHANVGAARRGAVASNDTLSTILFAESKSPKRPKGPSSSPLLDLLRHFVHIDTPIQQPYQPSCHHPGHTADDEHHRDRRQARQRQQSEQEWLDDDVEYHWRR